MVRLLWNSETSFTFAYDLINLYFLWWFYVKLYACSLCKLAVFPGELAVGSVHETVGKQHFGILDFQAVYLFLTSIILVSLFKFWLLKNLIFFGWRICFNFYKKYAILWLFLFFICFYWKILLKNSNEFLHNFAWIPFLLQWKTLLNKEIKWKIFFKYKSSVMFDIWVTNCNVSKTLTAWCKE